MIKLSPSILAADFAELGRSCEAVMAAGADMLHVDVMDGAFVPNITFGQPVIRAMRAATKLPLDVHMMVQNPERYLDDMAACGADIITIDRWATKRLNNQRLRILCGDGMVRERNIPFAFHFITIYRGEQRSNSRKR